MRWTLIVAGVVLADVASPGSCCGPSSSHPHPPTPTPESQLSFDVDCAGPGCAHSGNLLAIDCMNTAAGVIAEKDAVTLTSGQTVNFGVSPWPPGSYCVRTFLDVNTDGAAGSGDVTASGGDQTVDASNNGTGHATFVLDTVSP